MPAPVPTISYPPELPVSAAREELARAIGENQVVIVAGATGSGKTTQLPKICLELGRSAIAHTQPRRIAARTIAERIASELEVPLGTTVGYKVRFTDRVSEDTRIALMTDGILLNEIHRDRLLRRYDTIIIDEAHERSLNIDFLIGYLTRILPERPDLKVIVTSATIDPESFAAHFSGPDGAPAPIVEVSGRTFPVEVRYRPAIDSADEDDVDALAAALRELDREPPGDVLVFLPGEAEIRDAMDAVRGMYAKDSRPTEVLPLFGRLSADEQHRVFEPSRMPGVRRRVILATNVAETSLTVPGIRYVIDRGTARISRYSARAKIQRLPIEPVSQASAQQRSGRAGRTSAGIAIRLYSEEDFASRPEFTEPEILRTSLASVILQLLSLDFGDITDFPFLTPPDSRGVKAAIDLLIELRAVRRTAQGTRLTKMGREIARIPMDPRFARMLLEARSRGVLDAVTPIVAALSVQDVRERPEEQREAAERSHARFTDPTSDFLTLLNLWNHLREQSSLLGSSAFRRLCRSEFLNYVRVREWFDVHRQLRALLRLRGEPAPPGTADPDEIHRSILSGLLSQIGVLDTRSLSVDPKRPKQRPRASYRGSRGASFTIFPGSVLRRASPDAVMAGELVETSRLFARTVAEIDPAWAEELAGDLAHRTLSDPHWSKDAGAAVAAEKVTLFGVEIIPRRRVQLARIDRPLAREMFIRHALVEGDWNASHLDKRLTAFERRNENLRRRIEKLEERERRRDILAGDETVYAFYAARIPDDVFDVRSFETWWKSASGTTPHLLDLTEAELVEGATRTDEQEFPATWQQGDRTLSIAYRFEPGAPDDGVNIVVPLALLAETTAEGFDWQVPGLREELVTALLRTLPKAIRRHVVPATDWGVKLAAEIAGAAPEKHDGMPPAGIIEALTPLVQRAAGQRVAPEDFTPERVSDHLRVSFRVVDERGRTVGSGRDLRELQDRWAGRARESVARTVTRPAPRAHTPAAPAITERTGMTTWEVGDLPESVELNHSGGTVRGYPALVDDGASVSLRVESTAAAAERVTRGGVRRLLLAAVASPASYVLDHLTQAEKLSLAASPYSSVKALIEDARVAIADDVVAAQPVRGTAQFERARDEFARRVTDDLFRTVSLVAEILTLQRDVNRAISGQNSMTLLAALGDLKSQGAALVFPGFIARTGLQRLTHLPRYLRAMSERVRALAENPGRDRTRMTEFERVLGAYSEAGGSIPSAPEDNATLVRVRWMLEELRVSLFAQKLGTAESVSPQRILKVLREG